MCTYIILRVMCSADNGNNEVKYVRKVRKKKKKNPPRPKNNIINTRKRPEMNGKQWFVRDGVKSELRGIHIIYYTYNIVLCVDRILGKQSERKLCVREREVFENITTIII